MIRVIPFLEFIIFEIILFLGIPMGIVADVMGAQKGGTMIMNYAFGLVAFSFIDVALAIVQSISMYYYGNKMSAVVSQLGSNPFTPVGMSEYLQNLQYMQGMMGLASVITVPLVVGIVFKGETMAALGAMNSVMGKYSGDKGGASAKDALASQSSKHQFEAHEQEAYARGELKKYGIDAPRGASAVQTLDNIIAEGEKYGQAGGSLAAGSAMNNGDMSAFAFQSGTSAVSSFKATAALGHTSQEDGSEISRSNQVKSAVALAGKAKADEVGAGLGLIEKTDMFDENGTLLNNDRTSESIKGAKITSAQKALSQIGLGSTGDIDKISKKAFEDGARSGETMNDASDLMFSGKKDKKKRKIYDRDKAAKGAALKELGSLQADAQTAIAADEKTAKEKNGDVDYIMGTGAQARKAANDMIGVGETFGAMSNEDQIALMKKEKKNASTGFFGGIEATNAEIMEHNGGKDAIKDMVTSAKEKGISSATHASNLRQDYGSDLNKKYKDKSLTESIQGEIDDVDKQISSLDPKGKDYDTTKKELLHKKDSLQKSKALSESGITLADTSSTIDQSKLQSMMGQALGVKANNEAGVNYAQNAMYGEESKQQSTKAKIDTQGGVESAVATDVAEASMKAKMQQLGQQGQLEQYLQSKAGGSHSKEAAAEMAKAILAGGQGAAGFMKDALASAGALAHSEAGLKTASSLYDIDAKKSAGILDKDGSITEAGKAALSIKPGEDANAMMGKVKIGEKTQDVINEVHDKAYKQAMALTDGDVDKSKEFENKTVAPFLDKHGNALQGQAFWNKQAELKSGMFSGSNGMMFGNGMMFSGGLGTDGSVSGKLSSGVSTNFDDTTKASTGYDLKAHVGNMDKMRAQKAEEWANLASHPTKLIPKLAGLGFDAGVKKLEDSGMSHESAVAIAGIMAAGGAGITTAGIIEYSTRFKNSLMGNRTATKDFSYDTGNVDNDGKPVMKPVKKGEHFSTKSNAALANYVKNNKDVSVAERGLPSKAMETLFGKSDKTFEELVGGKSPLKSSDSPMDGTKDVSPDRQDSGTEQSEDGKENKKINHGKSLNKDTSIVTKYTQKVNKALDFLGRPLAGVDAVYSGLNSYEQFQQGDTKHGMLSAVQSLTATAFATARNPVTGTAYGISSATNMVVGATDYLSKNGNTTYTGNNPLGAGLDPNTQNNTLNNSGFSNPFMASVFKAPLSVPSGGGFVAPTMVQQAADNHSNAQQFAQAIAAQGPQYGPSATEASTSRMADILQDQSNAATSFNKKMEINSNAAYTKDTMNHKEMLEHQALVAGLNPDKDTGAK